MRTRSIGFRCAVSTAVLLALANVAARSAAQTNKLVWDKDVGEVKRVAKPGRKPSRTGSP